MPHRHNPAEAALRPFRVRQPLFARPTLDLPVDAHWDGQRFHNPDHGIRHGWREALRWLRTRRPARWPVWHDSATGPTPAARHSDDLNDWRATFVNHATVLVQIGPWNLLTDPVWSDRCSPLRQIGPRRVRQPGLRLDQLPPIHAVLLSHDHYDHLDLRTLLWLNRRDQPLIVTGLGVGGLLRDHGIDTVVELDWWQSAPLGPLQIHFLPAQHFSGRGARDRNATLWGSLMVTTPAQGSCYFAGDTGLGSHFAAIRARLGAPRLALLPIGAYEPRWFMGPVHMDPADAVRAHHDLGAAQSLGIHFNTFQLTDEAIGQPLHDLRQALQAAGVAPHAFRVLAEGQGITV